MVSNFGNSLKFLAKITIQFKYERIKAVWLSLWH